MIEGEHPVDARRARFHRDPGGGPGSATRHRIGQVRREHQVADGDDPPARIALGCPERGQLLQMMAAQVGHA